MELDITTLEYTYLFLVELETQGFKCYKIVFKVISRITGKISYLNFDNLQDFYNRYVNVISNVKPNRYCIVGDFIFLENIKFVNLAVNYENTINYLNISNGNPKVKIDISYYNYKNSFLTQDVKKFVSYLKDSLVGYYNKNTMLKNARSSAYVDACYVNPGYVGDINFNPNDNLDGSDLE
jgi:hypothetical protein